MQDLLTLLPDWAVYTGLFLSGAVAAKAVSTGIKVSHRWSGKKGPRTIVTLNSQRRGIAYPPLPTARFQKRRMPPLAPIAKQRQTPVVRETNLIFVLPDRGQTPPKKAKSKSRKAAKR